MGGDTKSTAWRGAVGIAVLAVVLVGAVTAGVVLARQATTSEAVGRTDSTDPRIQPLADFVAVRRGAPFLEPVPIEFVDDETFAERILGEEETDEDRAALDTSTVQLRALGLLGSDDDLAAAFDRLSTDGILAFYSPTSKSVTVRGNVLDTAHRSTVVHELVHAWQDQHVGLGGLRDLGSTQQETLRIVVEGDATLVQRDWAQQLPTEEREAYARDYLDAANANRAAFADLPGVALTSLYTPYVLGPGYVEVLRAQGGSRTVDAALAAPVRTEAEILDPTRPGWEADPPEVAAPTVPDGAEVLDDGPFGAYSWLVVLSDRLSARGALEAVGGWDGDRAVVYRADGRECMAATVKGRGDSSGLLFTYALQQWAAARPAGSATVETAGDGAVVRSCADGGTVAATGTSALMAANYAGIRLELAGTLMRTARTDMTQAMCAATTAVNQLGPEELEAGRFERLLPSLFFAVKACTG